jgi:hypothetical protein
MFPPCVILVTISKTLQLHKWSNQWKFDSSICIHATALFSIGQSNREIHSFVTLVHGLLAYTRQSSETRKQEDSIDEF